jgi:hypothetical protein
MTSPDGAVVVRKTRMSAAGTGKPGLVGVWKYRHSSGATAFERYTDDGKMFFRLPMRSVVGRYTMQGNEVVLVRPDRADVTMTLEIRGDMLSLSSDEGKTDYRRDPAGTWYDSEHIVK